MEDDNEPPPTVFIGRDWHHDRWVYIGTGAHLVKTPFAARAPFDDVARWLVTNANGKLRVRPAQEY